MAKIQMGPQVTVVTEPQYFMGNNAICKERTNITVYWACIWGICAIIVFISVTNVLWHTGNISNVCYSLNNLLNVFIKKWIQKYMSHNLYKEIQSVYLAFLENNL